MEIRANEKQLHAGTEAWDLFWVNAVRFSNFKFTTVVTSNHRFLKMPGKIQGEVAVLIRITDSANQADGFVVYCSDAIYVVILLGDIRLINANSVCQTATP